MQNDNKRRFSRIVFDAPVLMNRDNQSWETSLIDISLKGVLIQKPEQWQDDADGDFDLEINLDNSDIQINMQAHVAHEENDHVGFRCDHIDLDSISRLKQLVLINIGDESILERELSYLAA